MPDLTEALATIGLVPHHEQTVMAEAMSRDASEGAVTLIEAPTASGKTLAIAWHACSLNEATGERALIAVPTIAVMRQTLAATRHLAASAFPGVEVASVLGRQEFVHHRRARAWIAWNHADALPAYDLWASLQDAAGWTRGSLDEALRGVGHDLDMPPETTMLMGRSGPAEDAYQAQFATGAGVVVCTHSLLARDVATRAGRVAPLPGEDAVAANERRLALETADDRLLPEWRHLVVDEAHQLAAGFMLALTTRLSFRRLLDVLDERAAAGAPIPPKSLANLRRAVDIAERDAPSEGIRSTRRLSMDRRHDAALARGVTNCVPEDPADIGVEGRTADNLLRFRDAALLAQRNRTLVAPSVTWSEVEGALGLSVTPLSFGRQLDFMFRSCRSAALVSATLYSHDDEIPHDHVARQLALPVDRLRAHPALPSRWSTDPVTLHMPDRGIADDLDPRRRDWTSTLAEVVAEAASEAAGGTLVLCTSHATVAEVAALLDEDHGDRVMVTDDRGVGPAADRFVAAARAGTRPVWIATGPAWTGLDLPDDVLDALVVARLPFGLANPILHDHLTSVVRTRLGYRDMETDMLKVLRQGVGRLVRGRAGDRRRHLWMADGRLAGQPSGVRAAAVLSAYPDVVEYGRER